MGKETADDGSQATVTEIGIDRDIDLEALKNQRSTTADEERPRCPNPECGSVCIHRMDVGVAGPEASAKYRCNGCGNRFETPVRGVEVPEL